MCNSISLYGHNGRRLGPSIVPDRLQARLRESASVAQDQKTEPNNCRREFSEQQGAARTNVLNGHLNHTAAAPGMCKEDQVVNFRIFSHNLFLSFREVRMKTKAASLLVVDAQQN